MVGELMVPRRGSSRTAAKPIDCLFPGKKETVLIVYNSHRKPNRACRAGGEEGGCNVVSLRQLSALARAASSQLKRYMRNLTEQRNNQY